MHGGYRRVPHFVLSGNRYKQRKRKLSASAKKKKEKALAATSSSTSSLCVLCSDVCFMRPESCGNLYYNKTKKTAAEAKKKTTTISQCARRRCHFSPWAATEGTLQRRRLSRLSGFIQTDHAHIHIHTVGRAFCLLFATIKRKENSHTHTQWETCETK